MDIIKSGALRLAFQLSCARGIEKKKIPNPNSLLSRFQEPAARTERLWVSSEQSVAERRGEAGGGEGIGRTFLLLLLFLFFWLLAGTVSDPICFQLPVEDDVSPLPVRYVLHMQTPKHPGVSPLSSHPSFPSLAPSLSLHPLRAK